ncbi:MAG: peptidase M13 [Bacteroidetes bacterium]|nr:MAG: peptidase M13 [Bacteroidota bacterium]
MDMRKQGFLLLAGVALSLAACNGNDMKQQAIDPADLNTTVAPGDDFYEYSNGGWIAKAEIPADRARFGAFDVLQEETQERVKELLFAAADKQGDTTSMEWLQIGDFFRSGMDTTAIEEAGISPIAPDLQIISGLQAPEDIVREIARERSIGGSDPFYVTVEQDSKNATEMILSFYQSGLGMPDRSYYFNEDERSQELRQAYVQMIDTLFQLMGRDEEQSSAIATDILALETKLAEPSLTRLQYRDPHLVYNKLSAKELSALTPNIDWDSYFLNLGVDKPDTMLVDNPKFLKALSSLLVSEPINVWKDYLTLHYVLAYAGSLSTPFEDASFAFYGTALTGQQEMRPRWKRVAGMTQRFLGEAIGKFYVEKYFPAAAKEKMLELVENLRTAYAVRLGSLEWMSEETKKKAQEKLAAMVVKIGYPDQWRDYMDLMVVPESYAFNVRNGYTFQFNYTMSKLGQPVDRTEWHMTPQTINAYYSPTMNEIVFPAGILQPPFFDMEADDAVNYGAIGVVIAHEMTHGFDDQGRKYNKDGNLQDWWTAEDAERFNAECQLLVEEFDAFELLEGQHVDGKLTLGENLADFGGLVISMAAFKHQLANVKAEAAKEIDGFLPLQRFFLAYSKVWRNKSTEEDQLRRLKEDVHSPGKFRVDGAVYNIPEFYQAFEVSEQSPYYRPEDKRPSIW